MVDQSWLQSKGVNPELLKGGLQPHQMHFLQNLLDKSLKTEKLDELRIQYLETITMEAGLQHCPVSSEMLGKGASRNFQTIFKSLNEIGLLDTDVDENILNIDYIEDQQQALQFEVKSRKVETSKLHLEVEQIEEKLAQKRETLQRLKNCVQQNCRDNSAALLEMIQKTKQLESVNETKRHMVANSMTELQMQTKQRVPTEEILNLKRQIESLKTQS